MSQSDKPDTEISIEDAVNKNSDADSRQETMTDESDKWQMDEPDDAEIVGELPLDQGDPPESMESLRQQLAAANEQIASLKDDFIRAQAEMQNVRKRLERDVENAHKYGLERFLINLLPVTDALEKAIESANQAEETNAAIAEGVELCLKMLLDVMAKENIEQISPQGEPFDPKFHEAMSVIENPDVEPNSVVNVFQKGYTLNGRLVKPALVIVSKSGEQK